MKIGITERGDASIDMSWVEKLNSVDGAILITKNITDEFIEAVLRHKDKVVLHATCTGWGGTAIEPYVPNYRHQLSQANKLVKLGFPINKVVIRVDPIIPTSEGIEVAAQVFAEASKYAFKRFRISVIDTYPHVRQRFKNAQISLPYGDDAFQASDAQFSNMKIWAETLKSQYPDIRIECCAEHRLGNAVLQAGCISEIEISLLGLHIEEFLYRGRQRSGCCCLPCKTELLTNKHRCPNGCLYCYWKD